MLIILIQQKSANKYFKMSNVMYLLVFLIK